MTEQKTIASFVDLDDDSGVDVLDRSDLEKFGLCPLQAVLCAAHPPLTSFAAESGQQVHDAYGETVGEFIASGGAMSARDLTDCLMGKLRSSRPDVQVDALTGGAPMAKTFCYELTRIGHMNIISHDGGEDDKCSQYSWEIEGLGLRVTSELDLLIKTGVREWRKDDGHSDGREVVPYLRLIDFKTGRKKNTATEVLASFQFQMHAALVFHNFHDVDTLAVEIWDTRSHRQTQPAIFERRFLSDYECRIRSAAGEWYRFHDKPIEDVPGWPLQEKCSICDVVKRCTIDNVRAEQIERFSIETAAEWVDAMIVADERKTLLVKHVDKHGAVLSTDGKTEFGRDKPGADRKKPAALYQLDNRNTEAA